MKGAAKFTGPHSVEVDGKVYNAKHIVIATGGAPNKLGEKRGEEKRKKKSEKKSETRIKENRRKVRKGEDKREGVKLL